jgi:hypothetical protein
MGFGLDDWTYWHLIHVHSTWNYRQVQRYRYFHTLQFTVTPTSVFSLLLVVSWQRIHNSLTVIVAHYEVFVAQPNSFLAIILPTSQTLSILCCNCQLRNLTHRKHRSLSYPREYICVAQQQVVYQEFISSVTCLPSRCLPMDVSSDFTIPAFGRHVTIDWFLCYETLWRHPVALRGWVLTYVYESLAYYAYCNTIIDPVDVTFPLPSLYERLTEAGRCTFRQGANIRPRNKEAQHT